MSFFTLLRAHVVRRNDCIGLQERLRELRLDVAYRFEKRVVSPAWVYRCIERNELLIPTRDELVNISL